MLVLAGAVAGSAAGQAGTVIENEWRGRLVCGADLGVVTANPCAFHPDSNNVHAFAVPEGIKTLSVGMTWEPLGSGAVGDALDLLIENEGCNPIECSHRYASLTGPPPLVVNIHNDDIPDPWKWDEIVGSRALQFRVFPGDPGLVLDQSFTVHYHFHMHEEAPPGYDPIPGA